MAFLRITLVVSAIIVGFTSALLAQAAHPFPPTPRSSTPPPADTTTTEPPAADGLAAAPSTPTPRAAPTVPASKQMDKAHRDRLLRLLAREGKRESLDPIACAALDIRTGGKPLPVMQVAAVEGKTRATFNRVENKKDEYIFSFDDDTSNPDSHGLAFRAGANFRLIGGAEFVNGQWTKMPPEKSAALYAEHMRDWVDIIDAN